MTLLQSILRDDSGQSFSECALIVGLVCFSLIAVATAFHEDIGLAIDLMRTELQASGTSDFQPL